MAYTVVVDANILYDAAARDLLIRFAMRGLVRVRWTEHILDECFHSESIARYHLEVIHPDDFFVNQIDLDPIAAVHVIQALAQDLQAPAKTPAEIVDGLESRGLAVTASRLRELLFEPESEAQ